MNCLLLRVLCTDSHANTRNLPAVLLEGFSQAHQESLRPAASRSPQRFSVGFAQGHGTGSFPRVASRWRSRSMSRSCPAVASARRRSPDGAAIPPPRGSQASSSPVSGATAHNKQYQRPRDVGKEHPRDPVEMEHSIMSGRRVVQSEGPAMRPGGVRHVTPPCRGSSSL